jgi:hypothetical protein
MLDIFIDASMNKLKGYILYRLILVIGFIGSSTLSYDQIRINEFLASNSTINTDPDFNTNADWLELYNDGPGTINLKGYFLTDNFKTPGKWQIDQDLLLPSKGYVIIWTDGNNTGLHTSFKLSANGEEIGLYSPTLVLIDSISFTIQKTDISFGRKSGSTSEWGYFLTPTPAAENNTDFYTDYAKNTPEFTITGGIYTEPQTIELYTDLGGLIRFTTDGSEPTTSSPLYVNPILVNSTEIIRARIFKPGMIPGPITTHSYFINENFDSRNLPVVSIATNPANFWDPTIGIYVQNFKPLWEIPVNVELFENNGSDRAAFNLPAGIKVNGLYSWQLPQKMLGVYFKGQYGAGSLDYSLLFNKQRSNYKTFALRASGNDWSNTMFRDILGQNATLLNMHLDMMGFRHAVMFVNGQYMGIHNIREKVDEYYIEANHGMAPDSFDLVENQDYPEAGNLDGYNHLLELVNLDLSIQSNYDAVAATMDIENFTDLVITEMAVGNTSIDHNVMAWKPRNYGKWKWVLMDLDRGFFNPTSNLIDFYVQQTVWPFSRLMRNSAYKSYFGKRLADHLYTSFHPARMNKLIDEHEQTLENEIPFHVARWLGTTSSYGNAMPSVAYWYSEVCKLRSYVEERPQALLAYLNNYGFIGTSSLSLAVIPANAGSISMNGMKVPESSWTGPYLKNVESELIAIDKPGYLFKGWVSANRKVLISKGSIWKYLDNGTDAGTNWADTAFNDAAWKSGKAQLGYGDGDEITTVDYGGDNQNRYITTYFRQAFTIDAPDLPASNLIINLLKDDGAVVYLNGFEVLRANMPCITINYQTLASSGITGSSETIFTAYPIPAAYLKPGKNVLAVEIHQNAKNSGDLSFDLELASYTNPNGAYLSTNHSYKFTLADDMQLTALYEPTGQCIVPELVDHNLTLDKACSPYLVQGDITIAPSATLTINPGVEILMAAKGNIMVKGIMNANGTASEPVIFKSNPVIKPESWGAITFLNTPSASHLTYVTLENSSQGAIPIRDYAAISAYKGDLVLDHLQLLDIDGNPIVARYSNITLSNSQIHSRVVGDGINVKYGHARVENSEFFGNNEPNTDAIDYDGIENGLIRNCIVSNFTGFNSDGVDIGEQTKNLVIDSVFIHTIFDKGISVGQRSSVTVTNSTIANCNLGLGLKDLSPVRVDHCSFYNVGTPVACYEKNPGSAGGHAIVTNSVLSNSSTKSFSSDSQSTLSILYSLSDNDSLPPQAGNLFGNPQFSDPTHFDFHLLAGSPGIKSGNDSGQLVNMGSSAPILTCDPFPLICRIFVNSLNFIQPEFIGIYNPGTTSINLSKYSINKGVSFTFPEGISLGAGDTLYITENAQANMWWNFPHQVYQWESGKLSDNGEAVQLVDNYGIVTDYLSYAYDGKWPSGAFTNGEVLCLVNSSVDNHFPENWKSTPLETIMNISDSSVDKHISIYPNPARDKVTINSPANRNETIDIYSVLGNLLDHGTLDEYGSATIDLSNYSQGVLLIRIGKITRKVIIVK